MSMNNVVKPQASEYFSTLGFNSSEKAPNNNEEVLDMVADFQSCLQNACGENGGDEDNQKKLLELGRQIDSKGLAVECLAFV